MICPVLKNSSLHCADDTAIPQEKNIQLPYDPTIPISEYIFKRIESMLSDICTLVFIAVIFTISKGGGNLSIDR